MGHILGNLTNAQVALPGGGAMTAPQAQNSIPSMPDPTSGLDAQPKSTPSTANTPSFLQAMKTGPGGTPNAMSPELTTKGKILTSLISAGFGALAGAGQRTVGQGFQQGAQLPFQQAEREQQAKQAEAQTALTQSQTQSVQTPYGMLPPALAKAIFPASIRAGAQEQAATTRAGATTQAAQIGAGARTGAAQIGADARVKASQLNLGPLANVSHDLQDQFGLPAQLPLKMLNQAEAAANRPLTQSTSTTTDPLGQVTTKTTSKQRPGANSQGISPTPRGSGTIPAGASAGGSKTPAIDDMARKIVEGESDPSQLSKRAASYYTVLSKADQYSQQKYGQPFNIAKASTDYKYANEAGTQNTLKMIDAITAKGGSLEIAMDAAKKLPRMNEQTMNNVFNLAGKEFGSSELSNFHTAMLGLADEYSKVMGGGVSSDTGRQQGLDLLKSKYSAGQFDGAGDIIKRDVAARKQGMIGDNRYLQRQFGQQESLEGRTATGPGGHKIKFTQGKWVDAATGAAIQ